MKDKFVYGVCWKTYNTISDRNDCETKCLARVERERKQMEREEELKQRKKRDEEKKRRYQECKDAYANADKLYEKYVEDYGTAIGSDDLLNNVIKMIFG